MLDRKIHENGEIFAVKLSAKGFAFSVRRFFGDALKRRQHRIAHQQAIRELNKLPPELKRDIGWPQLWNHDEI